MLLSQRAQTLLGRYFVIGTFDLDIAIAVNTATAFFKAAQKSLISLREAMQGGLVFLGTNLIRCCKKARVSFSMWGYEQMGLKADGVWGREG